MLERRLTCLAAVVLLWAAFIFQKLISLQVIHHEQYLKRAIAIHELPVEIPAPRGTIFDRTGQPLAMSVPARSVYVNPLKVPDLGVASEILALVLHMDQAQLHGRMKQAYDRRRGFLWIKRKISAEEGQSLRNLGLNWIHLQGESQRRYPGGALAAHILGGVDFQEHGNAGIEKALDSELGGQPGKARLLTDVKRRGIEHELAVEARPGRTVTLTIEGRLQFIAERELAAAVQSHQAASGSIVVMNPQDGQILAMASYPVYDPDAAVSHSGDMAARANHAISVPFEPGSVFKVITLSAALETTDLNPRSMINCGHGAITLFGRTIHEAHGGYGTIPMATVLAKSSNVGAIQIGGRVGAEKMYEYVRKFGFGQRTGIQLPGESRGRLRTLKQWGKTSLASISMGQEISVTTVQLARAASVIANGGLLVTPRLVLKKGGQVVPPEPPARVIKPETAITMRQMMEGVVLPGGTGTRARLAGYTSGGKTGSAQIFDFAARHYTHTYNGSFVGFAPVTNPAIVVVVTLNGTHGTAGFGGVAAAPVFQVVASEALRVIDVPKDLPDEPPARTLVAATDTDDLAIADLGSAGPNILEDGDGDQAAAQPSEVPGVAVPNFRGMTMRAVLAEAARKGLVVQPDGSGVARLQSPAPGSILQEGERIRVRFAR